MSLEKQMQEFLTKWDYYLFGEEFRDDLDALIRAVREADAEIAKKNVLANNAPTWCGIDVARAIREAKP